MVENRPLRVLVVDDDVGMITTLQDIMASKGYQVDVAYSGAEAIERVQQQLPNCILMDIKMPDMDGVDAFRRIKSQCPEILVVFMTAYSGSVLIEEARQEGAVEVLPKPLELERVFATIEAAAVERPVLIVDDDAQFCQSLQEVLTTKGYTVRVASGAAEAVSLYERQPRGIVLLDMKLEASNGLDTLLIFKEMNPRAIVLLMTGYAEYRESMEQGLACNAYAAFMKPFDVEELIRTMEEAAAMRRHSGREPE